MMGQLNDEDALNSFSDSEGHEWRLAARAPLGQDLAALAAYLRQEGIHHRVTESHGAQAIWVLREQDEAVVTELLRGLETGRLQITPEPAQTQRGGRGERQNLISHGQVALGRIPVTCILLVLSIVGWLIITFEGQLRIGGLFTFVQQRDLYEPIALEHMFTPSQPWRLWTPMFLHFTIFHILFNALILWVFGGRIEYVMGSLRFLILVLVAGLVSNAGQYLWQPDTVFGGMSGVNYAFVGYIWLRMVMAPHPVLDIPMGVIVFMLFWLLLGVFGVIDYFMAGGIANGAHVCGLLVGVTWGAAEGWTKSR